MSQDPRLGGGQSEEQVAGIAVGIDLGTTYTAVACVDEYGKPVVLKNSDGQKTLPSVVFFDPPNYVVGEVALQSTLTDPDHVAQFVKRFMGVKDHRIHVLGQSYTPEFVSSLILRKAVQEAQDVLGEPVTAAVITVPAYFTEAQRHATYEAGQLAGLNVLRIINEPTAAALAYGMSKHGEKRNILVYDLGGGTFDVTILAVSDELYDVVAVGGNTQLGGKDFDDALMNHLETRINEELNGVEWDETLEAELRMKAEAAKRTLSSRPLTTVTIRVKQWDDGEEKITPLRIELTRDDFEEITRPLLEDTQRVLEAVLHNSGLIWEDIDEILCVGGSSQMPMVRAMLIRLTGRDPLLYEPDECVAKGAALQAALICAGKIEGVPHDIQVIHALPHALGVATVQNGRTRIEAIVPALSPLPVRQERRGFTTIMDDQDAVQVRIYEGDSAEMESYKEPVGVFNLSVNPPRPKGRVRVDVEFRCDENGRVVVVARDRDTGRENRTILSINGVKTNEEAAHEQELISQAVVS